ncbi:UDP glucuronosyltransferase 1 family, polypeptide B1 isoform X1 [Rhinichthys klamathensis goyatoka]|uniref:UDP glucuronosyltransferase 1 family, polypeptide B1 isoform X1 n=1 Tax=Rhinichthys klamathensis goyatoka TaxID=3034132 RepID=UPI0024B529D3|nr:UDP glucuronosyltransferase 1 family, polypeptide B1 isoform X1 [Rhinichthys klamathensis goyatoka]
MHLSSNTPFKHEDLKMKSVAFVGCLLLAFADVGETTHPRETGWTGSLLVVPMDGSHWTGVKAVAEEMGRRGHKVMVVIPEVSILLGPGKHYATRTFPVPYGQQQLDELKARNAEVMDNKQQPLLEKISTRISNMRTFVDLQRATAESLLLNQELVDFLRKQNFDAVLTSPTVPTGAILAYNLSLPAVYMLRGLPCGLDSTATACPNPPSYIPRFFTHYSDRMSFRQRVLNVLVSILEPLFCRLIYWSTEDVASRFLQRDVSVVEILQSGALWLLRYDFNLEFPKPLMPNMVLIGGINCAVKRPLIKEVEEFVKGSGEHGIVVFSLGSLVSSMPKEKAAIFFEAFSMIPQRVLWRYTGEIPDNVPENVKLMKWLPQNDLLGHPKAKAFITHGGTHGIYEGICHGVPMVMLPLFGDQGDNVHRVATRGVGVILNIHDITVQTLVDALNAVINDSSYKQKMEKLSAIHNDRPIQPLDLAVYWTEFVMRHKGAEHLRPAAHDLNWLQYHSLDVIGFLLFIVLIVTLVTFKCCGLCWRRCCRKTQKRKED